MGLEIINEIKKEKGMTSKELSQKSGVPIGTLNKILNGQTKNPAYETIFALAKALECPVDIFRNNNVVKNFNLTNKESTIIDKYRTLDDKGKHTVNTVLDMEYKRCNDKDELLFAAHDKEDIDKNSPTYEEDNQHDIDIMMNDDEWK